MSFFETKTIGHETVIHPPFHFGSHRIKLISIFVLVLLSLQACSQNNSNAPLEQYANNELRPNLARELYLHHNGARFCSKETINRSHIWDTLPEDFNASQKTVEFYLRMGMCASLNGKDDSAKLSMYRAIHSSEVLDTAVEARKFALSYLVYDAAPPNISFYERDQVDVAWASQTLLRLDGKLVSINPNRSAIDALLLNQYAKSLSVENTVEK